MFVSVSSSLVRAIAAAADRSLSSQCTSDVTWHTSSPLVSCEVTQCRCISPTPLWLLIARLQLSSAQVQVLVTVDGVLALSSAASCVAAVFIDVRSKLSTIGAAYVQLTHEHRHLLHPVPPFHIQLFRMATPTLYTIPNCSVWSSLTLGSFYQVHSPLLPLSLLCVFVFFSHDAITVCKMLHKRKYTSSLTKCVRSLAIDGWVAKHCHKHSDDGVEVQTISTQPSLPPSAKTAILSLNTQNLTLASNKMWRLYIWKSRRTYTFKYVNVYI